MIYIVLDVQKNFSYVQEYMSIDYNTVTGTAHLQGKKMKYDGTAFV